MGDIFEDVIRQEPRQLGASLGGTRRAQLPLFAGQSDQHLVLARIAEEASEARVPDAAIEVVSDGIVPRTLTEAVARLEAIFPCELDGIVAGLEELEGRRLAWVCQDCLALPTASDVSAPGLRRQRPERKQIGTLARVARGGQTAGRARPGCWGGDEPACESPLRPLRDAGVITHPPVALTYEGVENDFSEP